jgi:DNA-binding response OmpR family regulator/HPt (histidine-containing phosphotransfer) domain-containing protein
MVDPTVRVLVVEDNPGDAKLVEWALAHEPGGGFSAAHAGRVAAAVEQVAKGDVGAVLLDLGLPDSRGMDGLRRVRAAAPKVPVIVLTGSEDPALVRQALLAGAQDYQIKGMFPPGHLANVIRGALRRQLLEQRLAQGSAEDAARLIAQAEDAVAVVGSHGTVLSASPTFLEITGLTIDGLAHPPSWLGEVLATHTPVSASDPLGLAAGVTIVERPDLGAADIDFVVRACGPAPGALRVIRVRALGQAATSQPEVTSEAPIDEAVFTQLRELAGGDPTFVDALVSAFLAEADPLVRSISQAASRGDAPSIVDSAHRLKSAAAQVGAMTLSRACGELEREARAGHREEIRTVSRRIAREHPRVVAALSKRLTPPVGPG